MIEPYYDEDGITIYNADCREVLPQLEPVDLVLTDPPYGLKSVMKGGGWANRMRYIRDGAQWDNKPADEETINLVLNMRSNAVMIWGGNYFNLPPARGWLVWNKRGMGFSMAQAELAWTNLDMPVRVFDHYAIEAKPKHPTEKPISVMKWCLGFVPNAKTILDPFMGSGTTLVAAKDLGLKAIGIEIEKKYCDIAVERLRQRSLLPAMA